MHITIKKLMENAVVSYKYRYPLQCNVWYFIPNFVCIPEFSNFPSCDVTFHV